MTGKEERETVKTHSVSCTRLDWERLRECARREGMSISRFVVDRALHRDPGESDGQPQDLALTGDGQRTLHVRVTALADLLLPLLEQVDAQQPNLPNAVRVLFRHEARRDDPDQTSPGDDEIARNSVRR